LRLSTWPVDDHAWFENLNTPDQWASYDAS
jgi:hypothetical protein